MGENSSNTGADPGGFIVLNGQQLAIRKHPTDFSVMASPASMIPERFERLSELSPSLVRAEAIDTDERDRLMNEVRQENVAHHIYEIEGTGEEIVIDDRVILNLRHEGTGELEDILREYHLVYEGRMGEAHVLRLTNATNRNPVKLSNELAEREGVLACSPHVMLDMQRFQTPALLNDQWYLNATVLNHPDLLPNVDIDAPEAWELTKGDPAIVIAVIDDGFDLQHPAFAGTRIHTDRRDFVDNNADPGPGTDDYHGTPVASIAVGAHNDGSPMRGIAPNCTFLPIRIGFGPGTPQIDILEVFRYVSARADVVNCSFGLSPSSFDPMHPDFRRELTRICENGGRRSKGLVMVFSASNDDAPTFLEGGKNINGVLFTRSTSSGMAIQEIPAGRPVFSGYPMTPGVVAVGAMTSLGRKSGYSCWGPHLTICAPSNNMHYIPAFVRAGADNRRTKFVANYRGLGQIAAVNREGFGSPYSPIQGVDNPSTTNLRENHYTRTFGGTSGAAPVVAGVAALVISANPELTAMEVRQILMATADTALDFMLDLAGDPNLQGVQGQFVNGHSPYFGAGKINAFHAVRRARALRTDIPEPEPVRPDPEPVVQPTRLSIGTRANLSIPDNKPEGIGSIIEICRPGRITDISVELDITHSYRGDLRVMLIAPSGETALLQQMSRQAGQDLRQTFTVANTLTLKSLVTAGTDVKGRWELRVSDNLQRDTGTLNTWFLELKVA